MKHLPEIRRDLGWTQAQLAERAGVSPQSVYALERGSLSCPERSKAGRKVWDVVGPFATPSPDPRLDRFRANLRKVRKSGVAMLKSLSDESGLAPDTVRALLRGQPPSLPQLLKLSRALQEPASALLGLEMGQGSPKGLKSLRKARGLSRDQVGALLGVSAQMVGKYERRGAYPTLGAALNLCREWGVRLGDLFPELDRVPEVACV